MPLSLAASTEPLPNLMAGNSERDVGKPKKGEGLWKPKSELPPNRMSGMDISGSEMSGVSFVGDHASSTSDVIADLWWSADSGHVVSELALLHNGVKCDQ